MDDTTTPTAAEVMGWNPTLSEAMERQRRTGGPTVDDMLAWIAALEDVEAVETWTDPGGCTVKVWFPFQSWPESYDAPTLHAALEAAVIAVGRAGIEPATKEL